jgi:hypothetical protein
MDVAARVSKQKYFGDCPVDLGSRFKRRPLALHLQRRAGKGPSIYLAHLFKTPKAASTQSPDEIA